MNNKKTKKDTQKAQAVDIDAILDDIYNAQDEIDLEKYITKHLKKYKGDKHAVMFAIGVGFIQGMPLELTIPSMKILGFSDVECVEQLKSFLDDIKKIGQYESKEKAEQIIKDMCSKDNELNN